MDNMTAMIILGVFAGIGAATIIALAVTQAVVLMAGTKDRVRKHIAAMKEHNTAVIEDKKERKRMIMEKKQDIENLRTADALAKLEGKKQQMPVKTERSKFVVFNLANAQAKQEEQTKQTEQEAEPAEAQQTKAEIRKAKKEQKKLEKREAKIRKLQEKADKAREELAAELSAQEDLSEE